MKKSTLPREIWRPIPGYEGYYSASDRGRIRSEARRVPRGGSLYRVRERVLRPRRNANGYLQVNLRRGGSRETYYVHRLVLLAFVGPSAPGQEACHNNGDRTDNRLDNLRWGTPAENTADQVRHGTHMNTRKTHCPRGHLLEGPNARVRRDRPGTRECLSCARATKSVRRRGGDLQTVSDDYYRAIAGPDEVGGVL